MKYLCMIYCDEAADAARPEAEQQAEMGAYFAYTDEIVNARVMVAGEALHPSAAATTVRVRDGKVLTTDGPFAEAKEQFGGYFLLDCKDLDEAIRWAAKIPHASACAVEVRPVVDFSQSMPASA